MAKIPLTNGFTLIPEGEHIFKITEVKYDEEFGKMEVKMVTAQGLEYTERFKLLDTNSQPNEKALNAFSYFAKTALNCYDIEEIDHTDLVGHFIQAEVVHTKVPSNKDSNKMMTFANLGDKSPVDGFEGSVPVQTPTQAPATSVTAVSSQLDLDTLLK